MFSTVMVTTVMVSTAMVSTAILYKEKNLKEQCLQILQALAWKMKTYTHVSVDSDKFCKH